MSFFFERFRVEIAASAGETKPEKSTPPATKPAPAMPLRLRKSARVAPAASAVSRMAPSRSSASRVMRLDMTVLPLVEWPYGPLVTRRRRMRITGIATLAHDPSPRG